MKKQKAKVFVGMSGGVDSSVAAALLSKGWFLPAGRQVNVVGVFMRFWKEGGSAENRCCSSESEKRARQVAAKLKIPFYFFDFENEFKKKIVDCFLKDYKAGLTPNPCVVCNKEIKIGLLLKKALALGADYIATGHYAKAKGGRIFRAKDKEKDQSYFLWPLSRKQLKRVLFPVGNYTKPEVRKIAEELGLPTYATPDSQEICFVPNTINDFLAKYIKQKEGSVVDIRGKVLGRHQGLAFYTIGQRKGIGLSGGPYWALNKDVKKNNLIVTKDEEDLLQKEVAFRDANWLSGKAPKASIKVEAKIRYRADLAAGKLFKDRIIFNKPQRAITPGQSVVFYKSQELIGGGIIC